jgi:hypothetical protein
LGHRITSIVVVVKWRDLAIPRHLSRRG